MTPWLRDRDRGRDRGTDRGRDSDRALAPPRGQVGRLRRQHPELRRWLSAGLVCAAAAVGLHLLAPTPPPLTPVLVAARSLASGHRLTPADVRRSGWLRESVPTGALTSIAAVVGQVVSGAMARGEPLTAQRLLGAGLLSGQTSQLLAVPVRLSDPAAPALLRPGDRVDVIAATTSSTVVTDVLVLTVVVDDPSALGDPTGSELAGGASTSSASAVLAVALWDAERLAHAEVSGPLIVAVHPSGTSG